MQLKREVDKLFRPLIGQKAWGASVGHGSFVTIEFGPRRLDHHHYHGEWHLWLYLCDWELRSKNRLLAHSESKRKLMQLAVDNLNGLELRDIRFDSHRMATEFAFDNNLLLQCKPYADAAPDEELWMLFMADGQVAKLKGAELKCEPADSTPVARLARR
ncbi:MAG: hypothetical protein WBX38_16385 [Candidatus Sulfotelmatobacter sp.]